MNILFLYGTTISPELEKATLSLNPKAVRLDALLKITNLPAYLESFDVIAVEAIDRSMQEKRSTVRPIDVFDVLKHVNAAYDGPVVAFTNNLPEYDVIALNAMGIITEPMEGSFERVGGHSRGRIINALRDAAALDKKNDPAALPELAVADTTIMDVANHTVTFRNAKIELTKSRFEVLRLLVCTEGVVTAPQIFALLSEGEKNRKHKSKTLTRVNVAVSNLRGAFAPHCPGYNRFVYPIQNGRKEGYQWVGPPAVFVNEPKEKAAVVKQQRPKVLRAKPRPALKR